MPIQYRKWFLNRLADEFKSADKKRQESRDRSGPRELPVKEMMENMHNASISTKYSEPKKFK